MHSLQLSLTAFVDYYKNAGEFSKIFVSPAFQFQLIGMKSVFFTFWVFPSADLASIS